MLHTLMKIVILGLLLTSNVSKAEHTNEENDRMLFVSVSGMNLSENSLKTLTATVQEDWSFFSMRACVTLTEDDYLALRRGKTFFDWWDSGEPSYEVWKGTVLSDGPNDEFIIDPSIVDFSLQKSR